MTIPESQLNRWADHGSQDASKRTHETIRRVLAAHQWPEGTRYDFYLQGSYSNDTNIRRDSDVDVVLELTSAFMHDIDSLSPYDKNTIMSSFQPPPYGWNDFRRDTLKALEGGFGKRAVAQGNKCIKLKADSTRLAADVVVCIRHRRYVNQFTYNEGIALYALHDKRWIVNYPREHHMNGAAKGRRTGQRYKRTVRMFKAARNHLHSSGLIRSGLAPSYFLECLLYNVPDMTFQVQLQETYRSIVNWMIQIDLRSLTCQNERQNLFGPSPDQWDVTDAKTLVGQFANLWNNWS